MKWLLPEAIEDVLPGEAAHIERLRRALLDLFAMHGYQLVAPPLLEYEEALRTGSGSDLDPLTFKLVDQLSGRTMALRADTTPQVARIDAHLLGRRGVARLCYCGSVLHTRPMGLFASREPLQIGAELYGHAGIEADIEIVRLLAAALVGLEVRAGRIDLAHAGLFRALAAGGEVPAARQEELFTLLRQKDVPALRAALVGIAEPWRSALLALPDCYGGPTALTLARRHLPETPAITQALDDLARLAAAIDSLPVGFDLADLRGYHYHSGAMFAAYADGAAGAIALGGRYDHIGAVFGRQRPASGFSLDLKMLARLIAPVSVGGAILAPWPGDAATAAEIARWRAAGERVLLELPGHEGTWCEAGCDRRLVRHGDGHWTIEPLKEK